MMLNPSDNVRDKILRYLYDTHTHARGPRATSVGIRELQGTMKTLGVKQFDVNSNLDYLVQKGWVKEVIEQRAFLTKRGTLQQALKKLYKISDIGIDRLETASTYRREESFSRINVTNVNGVTVIGQGNIVNAKATSLYRALAELEKAVAMSKTLSNNAKLNVIADLGTIQSQLSKPQPHAGFIRAIWTDIEKIVTGAEFVELIAKASMFIAQLFASGNA
jgi:hypothetical protein